MPIGDAGIFQVVVSKTVIKFYPGPLSDFWAVIANLWGV